MSDYWNHQYPAFPSDVPTAKLSKLSLRKLLSRDVEESQNLYEACREWGFFLIDLRDCAEGEEMLREVGQMFSCSVPLFDLDIDTKQKYKLEIERAYGYKCIGFSKIDEMGTPDRCEFWGIGKGNALGIDKEELPELLEQRRDLLCSFTKHAHALCMSILSSLEKQLSIAPGKLLALHELREPSADQTRFLKMAPQPEGDRRTSLLPHTDVGSITMLWNILGGLQVQNPAAQSDEEGWQFVKPEPGCAIVNMGDAMVQLTRGTIRSNLHRVAYAPGDQAYLDRYALAYFSRPLDGVLMAALTPGANDAALAAAESDVDKTTMKDWVARKAAMYRKGQSRMRSTGGKMHTAVAQKL